MNKLLVVPVIALLIVGCASKSSPAQSGNASGDLTVGAAFNPDPPKQGQETITITVKDASGTPVRGAIVKLTSAMPSMSMSGPAAAASDNGDGSYTATMSLQYATKWQFSIVATSGAKSARTTVTADVQ